MSAENYRIEDQHAVYFLTLTVTDWIDVYSRPEYKTIILDGLTYCRQNKGLKLYAWCLMSNHMHLVCQTVQPFRMSDFLRDFKQYTAKRTLATIQEIPERNGCYTVLNMQGNTITALRNTVFGKTPIIQSASTTIPC